MTRTADYSVTLTTIICALIAGCAGLPHTVEYRIANGRTIEIHTDAPKEMEPKESVCKEPWAGCYEKSTRRVFLRSPVTEEDVEHEIAHDAGLQHGWWLFYGRWVGTCAYVFVGAGKYKADTFICTRGRGEQIYSGRDFVKLTSPATAFAKE